MSAHQIDLISQAQQGNPKALSDLLNRALAPKHIVTRAKLQQNRLTIFAEGDALPDQASLVGVIKRGIRDLKIDNLISIKIYGKTADGSRDGWVDEIRLKDEVQNSASLGVAESGNFDWDVWHQRTSRVAQTVWRRGKKLSTDKRFIIGAISVISLTVLATVGIIVVNVLQTRTVQQQDINEARALVVEAKVTETSSMNELEASVDKLTEARDILRAIEDSRGSLYAVAQEDLEKVRDAIDVVESRIEDETEASSTWSAANQFAQSAILAVNNPPYPVEDWEEAREQLSKAIEAFKAIPDSSAYAGQAQSAVTQFEEKLAWINQGFANEQEALKVLQAADNLGQQAYGYTNRRSKFQASELTQAKEMWQKAIDQTKTVPPTSDAYNRVSERISLYTENMNKIEDEIREMNECWGKSYASQSLCNSVYLSLKNPSTYLD